MNDYPQQKYFEAVTSLATGAGSLRERLERAWIDITPVQDKDFNDADLRKEHSEVRESFLVAAKAGTGEDGGIRARLSQMTEDDMVRAARQIVRMSYRMENP